MPSPPLVGRNPKEPSSRVDSLIASPRIAASRSGLTASLCCNSSKTTAQAHITTMIDRFVQKRLYESRLPRHLVHSTIISAIRFPDLPSHSGGTLHSVAIGLTMTALTSRTS